jgi:hypothetical protein
MMPFRLSRRTALRAAGVAIGLPTLDAMLTDRGFFHGSARAQSTAPPVRLVMFFLPNGIPLGRFVPNATGAGYNLTPCLEPLKNHVRDITVISGVGAPIYVSGHRHWDGFTGFTTGFGCRVNGATSISIDQLAAQRRGKSTRFASLTVAAQRGPVPNMQGFNQTVAVNMSWQGPNQPVPNEVDPSALFQRLFGAGVPQQDPQAFEYLRKDRKSVLDHVKGELERLGAKLGAEDRLRIDAHLTGISELERRLSLDTQSASSCTVPNKPNAPSGYFARAQLLADLLATALHCNLTSYATFSAGIAGGDGGADAAIGLSGYQHRFAHAGNVEAMQRFTTVQMRVFARFIDRLKAASEAGRSVLHNSVVVMGTELGNGTNHDGTRLPFVVAGHAGGRLKSAGKHIRYGGTTPKVGRLLFTALRLAGIEEPSFARETDPLPELAG